MEGQSLADYLDATAHVGKIPSQAEIVDLLMPIAAALDSAHQRGELHGALKPGAIWLDTSRATASSPGEPTLRNFGMYQGQDPRLLPLNDVAYVAPEIAQGYPATSRSDLYSLGVILYELCTGALPFQGETASDILMQHIHSAPISPVLINPHIRPAMTAVIMRCLARDPAARFSSATALVTAAAKAMNVSVPESTSRSDLAPTVLNTPSVSDINDPNTPTYLLSPSSPQWGPIAPTRASSSTPPLPSPPVAPSITPVLPPSSTGGIPQVQPYMSVTPVPQQASGPHPVVSTSGPIPVIPASQQASGAYPIVSTSGPMPVIPVSQQASGPHPIVEPRGPTPVTPPIPPSLQPARRPLVPLFARAPLTRKRRIGILALLSLLLVVVIVGSVVLLTLSGTSTSSPGIVGHAFFLSSGLISTESNQGVTDGLRISLQNIPNPQSGKRYYGWLVSSYGLNVPTLPLGPLPVDHGQIAMTYNDPQHNNLLTNYSNFLMTEEDANQPPASPSLDKSVWRYSAGFSTAANMADPKRYSVLDHLRHLLSQDPKLKTAGLSGGLSEWLFRNTTKVLEAAGSARDTQKGCVGGPPEACDTGLILRQVARILDYLDGSQYVQRENIPPSIQGDQLLIDPTVAHVALLEFDTVNQEPPGYLVHIGNHLQEITQAPGATPDQRTLANRVHQDINNVQGWLDAVHADAAKLIQMSPNDLVQPTTLTILNDLFTQANSAFVGHIDPNTDSVKEGVVQIYYNIQALATFDVAPAQ